MNNSWNFNPERAQLLAEVHARPAQSVAAPAEILHVAFRADRSVCEAFFETLDPEEDSAKLRHLVGSINGVRVKIERHTEFMSCTVFRDAASPNTKDDLSEFVFAVFPMQQVEVLVLLKLTLVKSAGKMVKLLPQDTRVYGGSMRGNLEVRCSFKPNQYGYVEFFLQSGNQTPDEIGRRVQRIIEMETYRTMCLLGLTSARNIGSRLTVYEQELDALTISLRDSVSASPDEDEALFMKLSSLSERNNILASETRYRFAASRAYYDLVQQRISSLQEQKVGDLQTISGFLRARLEPTIATIESTARRQKTLTEDLSRALVLLRTRIELNLNKGNQDLLKSMDRRHDQQLKISRTVEGLSVVAITYYAVGLVSYLLKALAAQPWMPISETLLTALSVPFVLLAVWYSLHKVRNSWETDKT